MAFENITWASCDLGRRHGDEHFLVVGASGSGKSTLINHVLYSVISDPGVRALVYDPKQELIPFLYGIRGFQFVNGRLDSSVKVLHPFDLRAAYWDMAADIDSPISARQLATILVSDKESSGNESDSFFTSAVQDIVAGIILAFIECMPNPGVWTFRDILLTLLYEPYLDFISSLTKTRKGTAFPILHRLKASYFGTGVDDRTRANIRATINAKMAIYEPVAAAWHQASKRNHFGGPFSLKAWIEESPDQAKPGTILVLGNDEAARAALDPINQALFKRATELILSRPERTREEKEKGINQIWVFLDEVREAGKLNGLGRLLTKGRSKNACVVMGFQDIDGMRDVYGREIANEICAQFNNTAVLRVNSPETAQWGSDLFGRSLGKTRNISTGSGGALVPGQTGVSGWSEGMTETELPFLYTSTLLAGTNASAARKVAGYRRGPDIENAYMLPREQWLKEHYFEEDTEAPRASGDQLVFLLEQAFQHAGQRMSVPSVMAKRTSAFYPRPIADQYLQPWNQEDWNRLGLNTLSPTVIDPIIGASPVGGGGTPQNTNLRGSKSRIQNLMNGWLPGQKQGGP